MNLIDFNRKINIESLKKNIVIKDQYDTELHITSLDNSPDNIIINVTQNEFEWQEVKLSSKEIRHKCSRCNEMAIIVKNKSGSMTEYITQFCPNCGALVNYPEAKDLWACKKALVD